MKNEPVIVYADNGEKVVNVTLTTDSTGSASFSFNTSEWSEKPVSLQVSSVFVLLHDVYSMYIMQFNVTFHMCSKMICKLFFIRPNIREKSRLIIGVIDIIHQAIST